VRWLHLIRLLPQAGSGLLTVAVVLNVAYGLLPIAGIAWMAQVLVAVKVEHTIDGTALALTVGSLVVQQVLAPFQSALAEMIARRVDGHCVRRLLSASLRDAPVAALERPGVLDRLSDVRAAFNKALPTPGEAAAAVLALVARYATLAGSVVLTALVLHWYTGLLVAITAVTIRFGQRGSLQRFGAMWEGLAGYRRRTQYLRSVASGSEAAKEIRVLGLIGWIRAKLQRSVDEYQAVFWAGRRRLLFWPFLGFASAGLVGGGLGMADMAFSASHQSISLFEFAVALQAVLIPIRFGVYFPECDSATQFGWNAYAALLDFEASAKAEALQGKRAVPEPREAIRFERVAFAYPGGSPVFDELDLELPVGRSTAIVGLNGAGKTTLVKLLARFYDPDGGRITLDGMDLRGFDPHEWHNRLAVIFQDFVRYELTGAQNIALDEHPCPTCVRAAAARAGALSIGDLSRPLHSRYEGGRDLSGGQWQRIALARAFHATQAGASILVLDEPTAQLDVRAEVEFFDAFLETTRGLTTVVISHRFSTVRRADNIIVLEHGRVVEQGTHEVLVKQEGRYERMFRVQAERFA
jgi:ATP-binding cassette subfamily B protein